MYIDIQAVIDIVKQAGTMFGNRQAADHIHVKGAADFVTEVDTKVQSFVQQKLYELYPQVQFMGEEKSNEEIDPTAPVWILDPVDGTTNLIRDYKCSAVSLALFENREPVIGIVFDPYKNELFSARKGEGCFLNGKRVYVSKVENMNQSLVAIGTSPYYKEMADENFDIFRKIFKDCMDVRRSGSAAIDLAHVACGRIDCYLERRLKIWDYAAGMLLVREAGGCVLDYQGNDAADSAVADILAGNATIPKVVLEKYL